MGTIFAGAPGFVGDATTRALSFVSPSRLASTPSEPSETIMAIRVWETAILLAKRPPPMVEIVSVAGS